MQLGCWFNFFGRVVATLLLPIVLLLCGGFFGALVAATYESRYTVRWEQLPVAPEKPLKILNANINVVFIESATGNVYCCSLPRDRYCWVESTRKLADFMASSVTRGMPIPEFSDKAIDTAEVSNWNPESEDEAKYVISEDGQVWRWAYTPRHGFDAIGPGSLVGLVIGLYLLRYVWRYN